MTYFKIGKMGVSYICIGVAVKSGLYIFVLFVIVYFAKFYFWRTRTNEQKHSPTARFGLQPDPRGLGYAFYDSMLKNKDKLAQIYAPSGEKDTHGDLLQRSIRTAIAMQKNGVTPGDFVSLCTFNHLDSCTPLIASLFIGAKMATVDPSLSLEETIHLLKQAPPKIIFVLPEALEMIEKTIETIKSDTKIVVYGKTTKHIPFSDFLKPSDEEVTFKPIAVKSLKEIAMIFFTSGTSGFPKGICLSHYAIMCQVMNMVTSGHCLDLTFSYSCPYWTVYVIFLGMSIMSGGARLLAWKYDTANLWYIFKYKISLMFLNTIQILTMLSQGRPNNIEVSSVQDIFVGGGALMLDQMQKIKDMFRDTRIYIIYGQSEVPGPLTVFKPGNPKDLEMINTKPSSSGTGMPGISYKIANPETEEILGPNQEGELRVKTEFALTSYHNLDSSDIFDSEGWLKTGDVAYYDEDHCFYIVDRIKEMFKFQSWHVAPAVVESVILTHPAVQIAVVIGKPHEIDGDHPMGIVILKETHQEVTPEEIEKYVEERVHDRLKLRAGVRIVDRLPTTPSGKISRKKLRDMVIEGKI